jgi:hypothetical protein
VTKISLLPWHLTGGPHSDRKRSFCLHTLLQVLTAGTQRKFAAARRIVGFLGRC